MATVEQLEEAVTQLCLALEARTDFNFTASSILDLLKDTPAPLSPFKKWEREYLDDPKNMYMAIAQERGMGPADCRLAITRKTAWKAALKALDTQLREHGFWEGASLFKEIESLMETDDA